MSDDFEFMNQNEDPAADFLARESEELGELGEELGISQPNPIFAVDGAPFENGDFEEQVDNRVSSFGSRFKIYYFEINADL